MAVAKKVGVNNLEPEWIAEVEQQKGEDANQLIQTISKLGGVFEQSVILSSASVMIPTENNHWYYGGFVIEGEVQESYFCIAIPRSTKEQQVIHVPELGKKDEANKINCHENNLSLSCITQVTSLTHCTDAKSLIQEMKHMSGFGNALFLNSHDKSFVRQLPAAVDYGVFNVESDSENDKWVFVAIPHLPQSGCYVPFAGFLAVSARSHATTAGWIYWTLSLPANLIWRRRAVGEEEKGKEQEEEAGKEEEEGEGEEEDHETGEGVEVGEE